MDTTLADLDSEVQRRADELTPELLPRLLRRLLQRDSIVFCDRHDRLLFPYVRAQVNLTRIKRRCYYYDDVKLYPGYFPGESLTSSQILDKMVIARDKIRLEYRSTPCTCWVQHR